VPRDASKVVLVINDFYHAWSSEVARRGETRRGALEVARRLRAIAR
jgi:hypothetical protein